MTDLVITPANVESFGTTAQGVAGGTITAGQVVRKDASTGKLVAASDSSATNAAAEGIALNGASDGQPLAYHKSGPIDLGATLSVGKVYVLSTSGAIAPADDIAGGEFVTILGVATAADRLKAAIIESGVAAAAAVA